MATSTMKVTLSYEVKKVWAVVTNLENVEWRSDLERIETMRENTFREITKDGVITTFAVTAYTPLKRWEFDMENENMKGHWTGLFSAKGNETVAEFIEDVTAKKIWMKPFVGAYLKKQLEAYVKDLEAELRRICK